MYQQFKLALNREEWLQLIVPAISRFFFTFVEVWFSKRRYLMKASRNKRKMKQGVVLGIDILYILNEHNY